MSKNVFRFSLLLVLVIGCILFIHWKGYTIEKNRTAAHVEQTVSVRHDHDVFTVKQEIRNIPDGKYHIKLPADVKKAECEIGDGKACKWTSGKSDKLRINDPTVTFTYKLASPPKPSEFLLDDWGIKIEELPRMATRVQLTEQSWRNGSWTGGAELAGKESMEAIDYYVFESDDRLPTLFWQAKELVPHKINQHLTIYDEAEAEWNVPFIEKIVPNEKIYAIVTNHTNEWIEKGELLWVPGHVKKAEEQLSKKLLTKKLTIKKEEEWIIELIVSLLTGESSKIHKVEKMRQTVSSILTEDQTARWLESVISSDTEVSSEKLDGLLENTANIKTDFFQKNSELGQPFHPFYLMDIRDVFVDGQKADDIKILQKNDRTHISFIPLIENMGYHIVDSSKEGELTIGKDGVTYQFAFSKKIFTMNGEQFGFQKNPFFMNQGEVYLDTSALPAIFGIGMSESPDQINIK